MQCFKAKPERMQGIRPKSCTEHKPCALEALYTPKKPCAYFRSLLRCRTNFCQGTSFQRIPLWFPDQITSFWRLHDVLEIFDQVDLFIVELVFGLLAVNFSRCSFLIRACLHYDAFAARTQPGQFQCIRTKYRLTEYTRLVWWVQGLFGVHEAYSVCTRPTLPHAICLGVIGDHPVTARYSTKYST